MVTKNLKVKMNKTRNGFLDLIKFVATILIVFHHFQENLDVKYGFINFWGGSFYFGRLVELFFMISGFVMVSYIPRIPKEISFLKFITRRYLRLIPLVAISTICDCFFQLLGNRYLFTEKPVKVVFETILVSTGIQRIFSSEGTIVNNPMWYVSILILCYVIFYMCFYLSNKVFTAKRIFKLFIPFGVMLAGELVILNSWEIPFANEYVGRGVLSFFGGVIIGIIVSKIKIPDKVLIPVSGLCFLASIIPLSTNWMLSYFNVTSAYIIFICFAQILFISKAKTTEKIFNKSIFSSLAKISFHAYCFHIPVMSFFALFFTFDSFKKTVYSYPFLFMIIYVVILYILSCLSYRFIEKPLIRILEKKGY